MSKFNIVELQKGLWAIDDENDCSMYLVEGSEKALLIDTGVGDDKINPIVSKLTKKPIVLAITHAHIDHMYHADEFDTVYMHKADIRALHGSLKLCMWFGYGMFGVKRKSYCVKKFIPIDESTIIDLGDIKIRVLHSPGHTPGSVTFVDEEHGALFLGDAVGSGSGAWMWMPGCYSVKKYEAALGSFLVKLNPYKAFQFLGGHRMQGVATAENARAYPLNINVIEDMKILCKKMLSGEIAAENPLRISSYKVYTYVYEKAAMTERKSKIH